MSTKELLDEAMKLKPEERLTLVEGLIKSLGACRTWVIVASMAGEQEQSFTISRRIVVLCNEISGIYGPLSRQRSRSILSPTGS